MIPHDARLTLAGLRRYHRCVGFALWIAGDLAWAEGRHEYRPMGAAVISVTDRFRARDFDGRRRAPDPGPGYAGLFASLGDLNARLRSHGVHERSRGGAS
jgi:hypothetical protein